ncbi:AAA domain-containing protein [Aspergillus affinis]|uniref:AAA domain-containing protein n=1 Tax=Aspergillus affinis TaxID=1070780 RepID=UPI0022FE5773|nr:AAA domain-containing protein [Aspergillus affinis]KAI9037098.1 AAA domain-containing protein [Aspergillus affinis]
MPGLRINMKSFARVSECRALCREHASEPLNAWRLIPILVNASVGSTVLQALGRLDGVRRCGQPRMSPCIFDGRYVNDSLSQDPVEPRGLPDSHSSVDVTDDHSAMSPSLRPGATDAPRNQTPDDSIRREKLTIDRHHDLFPLSPLHKVTRIRNCAVDILTQIVVPLTFNLAQASCTDGVSFPLAVK